MSGPGPHDWTSCPGLDIMPGPGHHARAWTSCPGLDIMPGPGHHARAWTALTEPV